METLQEAQLYPWLLMQDARDTRRLIYYDISKKQYYKKRIPLMENKEICSCFYGWFILKDDKLKNYYIFNPTTSDMIQLPPLPMDVVLHSYLYFSPTDPKCRVIFFDEENNTIFFCKPKDEKFIRQELHWFKGFTMLGEKGYCCLAYDEYRCYATITFEESRMHVERLPMEAAALNNHCYYGGLSLQEYLVESCGELLLVCPLFLYGHDEYDIVVFKLDSEGNKWVETENIASSTIFIARSKRAIACNTQNLAVQKNSVYFFNSYERYFKVFNIEDGSFSKTLPCPITAQDSIFHWIMTDGSHPI